MTATFGAVGAMRDKLLGGEPCDLVILTRSLIDQLIASNHLFGESAKPLGLVKTGIAIKQQERAFELTTAQALKAALLASTGIYFPDPIKSTAGIHFMKVLKALDIEGPLASRLRPFANGATAMRALAEAKEDGLIGCMQVTEILHTPGVRLAGLLPPQFELATVYVAAIFRGAHESAAAADFIRLIAGAETAALRLASGFEVL